MSNILITGAAKGLGRVMLDELSKAGHNVTCYDIEDGYDVRVADYADIAGLLRDTQNCDSYEDPKLDVLINNAGVNLIDYLENVKEVDWDAVMDINAKGIFKMSQVCLPMLIKSKGTILNIVSNAAHMPMTSSLAYNCSKGAALIATKQLARELTRRHGITVFSVSPNKLKGTGMSEDIDNQVVRTRGWTMEEAQRYQLQGLLAGEETDPKAVAEFIAFLLQDKAHHKFLTGCDIPYGL
jgi:NAD(P)-dependent dehydrogenase (short-subunit alcohol dehydrogenase family)